MTEKRSRGLPSSSDTPAIDRLLVVLPAFNEAASLGDVLRRIRTTIDPSILVVSDASTDGSAGIARAHGAQVIELSQQIGAWGATQTGLRYARRHGYGSVLSLDADGQHAPESLPDLLRAQRETGADVIIGTFPQRLSAPKRLAWAWFRGLTGLGVEDLTSGLRIYGPRALRVLASPEATLLDYQDVGVLLLLRKYGLTVHEVPVTMYPRRNGHSRVFASWLTVARYMAQTTLLCVARIGRLGRSTAVMPAGSDRA
jgi:glycosyltransferase involved in cell wall biosynthesis